MSGVRPTEMIQFDANYWIANALVGCTVAPGFTMDDFEMGEHESLLACYPEHAELIRRLTR